MSSPSSEPDRKLITADAAMLAAQNERIDRLVGSIDHLVVAIKKRPTRHETARKRRIFIFSSALFGVTIIFAHDEHLEQCSPGTETKSIVEYVLEHPTDRDIDRRELVKIGSDATPDGCGVTFPLHSHDDEKIWPTSYNIAGLVMYGVLGAAGGYWAFRRPREEEAQI